MTPRPVAVGRRALVAGSVALATERGLTAVTSAGWRRTNHRGRGVGLQSGPALVLAAVVTARGPLLPAAVAGLGAAAAGRYDDAAGHLDRAKGLRGHAAAVREGRLTGGAVKVVGIGAAALVGVLLLPRRGLLSALRDAALVAGSANLLNLLDLRPGRALKVGLVTSAALREPGPAAASLALLPGDLRERTMLGDCGANGLGALLGLAAVERLAPARRTALLTVVTTLVLASERVSFTRVIESTPGLRQLDGLGRLP